MSLLDFWLSLTGQVLNDDGPLFWDNFLREGSNITWFWGHVKGISFVTYIS